MNSFKKTEFKLNDVVHSNNKKSTIKDLFKHTKIGSKSVHENSVENRNEFLNIKH